MPIHRRGTRRVPTPSSSYADQLPTQHDRSPCFSTRKRVADQAMPERDALSEETKVLINDLARSVVTNAMATANQSEPDPMLGEFSILASVLRSVVTRAGQAIPDCVAAALSGDDQLTVLREHALPLTRAAAEVVDANRQMGSIELAHDAQVMGSYHADLAILDTATSHLTILECRRGSVPFSSPKTNAALRTLRIASLTARRAFESNGYRVNSVSCGVFDRYGRAGYDAAMTLGPCEIDAAFDVPVRAVLDLFDQAIRAELCKHLLPVLRALLHVELCADRTATISSAAGNATAPSRKEHSPAEAQDRSHLSLNKIVGPAERRRQTATLTRRRNLDGNLH